MKPRERTRRKELSSLIRYYAADLEGSLRLTSVKEDLRRAAQCESLRPVLLQRLS